VLTLEFHYYQNDCKYSTLEPQNETIDKNGDLIDEQGNPVINKFALEKYQKDQSSIHPMSAFDREDIVNFIDSRDNILKNQRVLKNSQFTKVDPKYDASPLHNGYQKS
jgi:hypothetical protein